MKAQFIAIGDENDYLVSTSCIVENVNIFNNEKITSCKAKFRYRQEEIEVMINQSKDVLRWYDNMNTYIPSWYINKEN